MAALHGGGGESAGAGVIVAGRKLYHLPWRTARQIRADVDTELAFHIDMRVEALVALGTDPVAARAQSLTEFGDVDDARRYIGAVDGATEAANRRRDLMGDLQQDLVYALRKMRSAPGFAAAVIAILALGIGATTAIFSVVNGVLLEPLPFPHADRIVQLFQVTDKGTRNSVSQPNFRDWVAGSRSFAALALLWGPGGVETVTGLPEPVIAHTTAVTRDFFSVFGVQPQIGRLFNAEETTFGGPRAVVVSDGFWRERLGASSAAIGQRLTMGGDGYTVIGVMPPNRTFPPGDEIWMPLELSPPNDSRTSQGYRVVGRVREGVPLAVAQEELSVLSRRLKQAYGNETSMSDALMVPLREQLVGKVRTPLLVLLAGSAVLLLIACANALNLLMARMTLRQGELAVRVALGATQGRLTRQVLAESAVLVTLGAALGVTLAAAGVRTMLAMSANALPRTADVHVDPRVLGFALAVSAVVVLVLGLLAAWQGTRRDLRGALSAGQRSATGANAGLRRGVVLAQMALTVVLLVGAGILGRSFLRLLHVDPGFITEHLVVVNASPTIDDDDARLAYYNTLIDRVRALPGVAAVGAATGVPIAETAADGTYLLIDTPDQKVTYADWTNAAPGRKGHAEFRVVDGDYFTAMRIPVLRGRAFAAMLDAATAPCAAVVSAKFAAQTWPGANPIGKFVQFGNMDGDLRPYTVVGVVGDVRDASLAADPPPIFYAYLPQRPKAQSLMLVVQTRGDAGSVIASTRTIVHRLRPDVAFRTRTIDRVISASVADRRFTLVLIMAFGGTALVLSTLGVYSVVSYFVTQRTPEIGVRMALGAQRGDVLRLILGEGARLAGAGIVVGVVASLLLTRLMRGLMYGVSTTDPVAFGLVVALLATVALAASYVPARRAARVDPITVLRGA